MAKASKPDEAKQKYQPGPTIQRKAIISVPGYRENSEAMLARMQEVRNSRFIKRKKIKGETEKQHRIAEQARREQERKSPIKKLSKERFAELVSVAEEAISRAKEIEPRAIAGDPDAIELYTHRCNQARAAIRASYDEPQAQLGQYRRDQLSENGKLGATASHGKNDAKIIIREIVKKLARHQDELGWVEPHILWDELQGSIDAADLEFKSADKTHIYYGTETYSYETFRRLIQRTRENN